MKVIVYNASQLDKEHLALANLKKHKITVIASPLDDSTIRFCEAKDAVMIVNQEKALTIELLEKLSLYHIKYLITTSSESLAVDVARIKNFGFNHQLIHNMDSESLALQLVRLLDAWEISD